MDYGIYFYNSSRALQTIEAKIYHNTMDGGLEDGIYINGYGGSAKPDIQYNIITNFGNYGINNNLGSPTIDYNDVWHNGQSEPYSQNYNGCDGLIDENNLSDNPLFVGGGDYRLQPGSPCIDAIPTGDTPDDLVTEDLEGNFRPQGTGYDMGAYEFDKTSPGKVSNLSGSPDKETWSNDNTVEVSWTPAEDTGGSDLDGYSILWDTNPTTDPGTTKDIITVTSTTSDQLDDGNNHYFHIRAVDAADNWGATEHYGPFYIDATAPSSTATAPAYGNAALSITWTASDVTSGVALTQIWYKGPGGTWANTGLDAQTGAIGTFSFTPTDGDGTYYLATRSTDNAGNLETEPTGDGDDSTIYDTVSPDSPVIATNSGDDYSTTDSSITLEGTCSGDTVAIYVNGSADGVTYITGENSWTYTGTLQSGANTFNITAEDAVGNVSSVDSITITFALAPGIYYVDIENGTDDLEYGTSSEAGAWKTLHYAIQLVNDGDLGTYLLNVASGNYNIDNEIDANLTIYQDTVTIQGAGAGSTIIDGTNADSCVTGIKIAASNVTIKDLAVKGFSDSGIYISSGTGNIIEGCNVYDNSPYGILIEPYESTTSGNIIWNNCEIYHNEIAGIFIDGSDGNEIYGNQASIYDNGLWGIFVGEADNNLIHDNNIYWSGDTDYPQLTGILIEDAGSGNQIYRNEIHGHYAWGGIWVVGSSPGIMQNEIYDNSTSGITVDDATGDASPSIWNNLIYDTGENKQDYGIYLYSEMTETVSPTIYHNTIDGGSLDGIFIEVAAGGSANPDIQYNIITNFDQYGINNSGGSPNIDYNDVWNNSSGNYNGCSQGINDISEDPLYASYELESTSPCIDQIPTGDPVEIDFAGYLRPRDGGYDMGAYEFVSDITHDYSLAGGSGDVTDYRIFTVPVNLESGSALKAQMEDALGTYDIGLWRVFVWDGSISSYIEMDDPAFADLAVYPGRAFWVISTGSNPVSFSGQPAPDGDYVEVPLTPGWNMFALPWPGTTIDLDNIAVSDGANNYWITSDNNSLTQKIVWDYTGTGPDSGYEQLTAGSALQPGKGYWIKAEADFAVNLLVPKDNTDGYFEASSYRGVSRSSTTIDTEEEPPPPPGAGASDSSDSSEDGAISTSDSSGGRAASDSGGCFIATTAYGTRLHPYVETLRSFRDSYLMFIGFVGLKR